MLLVTNIEQQILLLINLENLKLYSHQMMDLKKKQCKSLITLKMEDVELECKFTYNNIFLIFYQNLLFV